MIELDIEQFKQIPDYPSYFINKEGSTILKKCNPETYYSENKKFYSRKDIVCHSRKGIVCLSRRKVKDRPSKDTLANLIQNHSFVQIGRIYGVSDNAIRKWCKSYGLPFRKLAIKQQYDMTAK